MAFEVRSDSSRPSCRGVKTSAEVSEVRENAWAVPVWRENRILSMRLAWALALAGALMAAGPVDPKPPDFFSSYCVGCHGPAVQMANRRFDQLRLPPADAETQVLLRSILDKLNAGAMPPR